MSEERTRNNDRDIRMRLYQKIKTTSGQLSDTFITPPAHWLCPNLFIINQNFNEELSSTKKNRSLVTTLSVWNTMIGSGIVSIPYYSRYAGIIPTIILNIVFGLICYYTCQVIVKTGGKDNDYSDTVHRYFGDKYGKFGRSIQIIFNLLINVGAAFIYFLIIKYLFLI
jgi:sodium-coupled neutral amino acid transporter 9